MGGAGTASPAQPGGPRACPLGAGHVRACTWADEGGGCFGVKCADRVGWGCWSRAGGLVALWVLREPLLPARTTLCILFSFMLTLPFNFFPI